MAIGIVIFSVAQDSQLIVRFGLGFETIYGDKVTIGVWRLFMSGSWLKYWWHDDFLPSSRTALLFIATATMLMSKRKAVC